MLCVPYLPLSVILPVCQQNNSQEIKFFLLGYLGLKCYNIFGMSKYQEWTNKLAVGLAFLAFVCLGSFLWDINENANDAKMDSFYDENPAPSYCWIDDIYAGVKKTKVAHILGSNCAKQIIPGDMVVFLSREEATREGYNPCKVCETDKSGSPTLGKL